MSKDTVRVQWWGGELGHQDGTLLFQNASGMVEWYPAHYHGGEKVIFEKEELQALARAALEHERVRGPVLLIPKLAQCARCMLAHLEVRAVELTRPAGEWTHWAACPMTGEPIMVKRLPNGEARAENWVLNVFRPLPPEESAALREAMADDRAPTPDEEIARGRAMADMAVRSVRKAEQERDATKAELYRLTAGVDLAISGAAKAIASGIGRDGSMTSAMLIKEITGGVEAAIRGAFHFSEALGADELRELHLLLRGRLMPSDPLLLKIERMVMRTEGAPETEAALIVEASQVVGIRTSSQTMVPEEGADLALLVRMLGAKYLRSLLERAHLAFGITNQSVKLIVGDVLRELLTITTSQELGAVARGQTPAISGESEAQALERFEALAITLYSVYRKDAGRLDGAPPAWERLSGPERDAWRAVARFVLRRFEARAQAEREIWARVAEFEENGHTGRKIAAVIRGQKEEE